MSVTPDWIVTYAKKMRARQLKVEHRESVLEAQSQALWERFAEKARELVVSFNLAAEAEYLQFDQRVDTEFSITASDFVLLKADWRTEQKCVECVGPNQDTGALMDQKTLEFDIDADGNLCFAFDEHLFNSDQALRELLEPVLIHVT